MAGELPPIPPASLPPKPQGLLVRLWDAVFPEKKVDSLGEGNAWYRYLFRPWSLPTRVAVFVAVVLVGLVVACWWEFRTNPNHVPWRYSLTASRAVAVLLLLMVIPVSVFQALKLWFQGEKSQFPDIDSAWQAGKEALRKQGLTLGDKPLFLVLGSPGQSQEHALFESSKSGLLVRGVPEGPAPLHWYADADRIYLCCTGASWLSALSALIEDRVDGPARPSARAASSGAQEGGPTNDFEMQRISATIMPKQFLQDELQGAAIPGTGGRIHEMASMSMRMPFGGLSSGAGVKTAQAEVAEAAPQPSAARSTLPGQEQLAIIQPSDAAEQEDRLESVCELLRHARFPYSPINGCLALLPFGTAESSPAEIEELSKAINTDLKTVHATLRVRFPVTAIFLGMEGEPGFRELMRRVGPERCAANRFGMGYDLRSPASSGELGTFSSHVCGVFEDWVYGLFREDQVLKRPGNTYLFALLCRIRSSFKDRLSELLSQGFGYSERLKPEDAPFLFSGCYFAATGSTLDQRAFVQGIAEKLDGEQDRLEWSQAAVSKDRRSRWLTGAALVTIAVMSVVLIAMIVMRPPWTGR